MALPNFILRMKERMQFKRFYKGYWNGYNQGTRRCLVANGRLLPVKITDINVYAEFSKHPPRSRKWSYNPWRSGFEYGYTEALSFYNAGESPVSNGDSFYSQDIRIRMAFERQKENF